MTARERVLDELAALGSGVDPLTLLGQVAGLARFADQVQGELARLAGVMDAAGAYAEAGYGSAAGFFRHGCGRSAARAGELVATGRGLLRLGETGEALAAGEISFEAAHVICRATAQMADDAAARAAEQLMLAAAGPGRPGPDAGPVARGGQDAGGAGPAGPRHVAEHDGPDAGGPGSGAAAGAGAGPQDGSGPDEAAADGAAPGGIGAGGTGAGGVGEAGAGGDGGGRCGGLAEGLAEGLGAVLAVGGLDPRELRRLGEELAYRADPAAVEERERRRFERRHLSFGLTLEDVGTISGACGDALSLEIIKTAAEAFSPPGGSEDTRTAAQRRMDGLTAACQAALDAGTAPVRHGAAPHVSVLVDEGTLAGEPGSAPAQAGSGTMLTAAQVMAMACRAEISVLTCRDGVPLDVGRMRRTETAAIRRALHARDRGCRWPGCGIPAAWCTAHHIRPWSKGGRTSRKTMILLCFVHHHYFIHYLGWLLTGDPDGTVTFTHPDGWLTLTSPLPTQPRAP